MSDDKEMINVVGDCLKALAVVKDHHDKIYWANSPVPEPHYVDDCKLMDAIYAWVLQSRESLDTVKICYEEIMRLIVNRNSPPELKP